MHALIFRGGHHSPHYKAAPPDAAHGRWTVGRWLPTEPLAKPQQNRQSSR